MSIKLIVKRIKEKKELSGIDDSIVSEILEKYLEKNPIKFPGFGLSEEFKDLFIKN